MPLHQARNEESGPSEVNQSPINHAASDKNPAIATNV
jgi:hypothetical protein